MGAPATRITAADFLTPPELAAWRLAGTAAGRIGGARLELICRAGRTWLGDCYQQVPVRVLPPFQSAADQPALLYLLNPTAGLMDGDGHRFEITLAPGAHAVIAGQSATRIHPTGRGFSTQQWHIRVAAGGVLVLLPGPAIPFRGCRYFQRLTIHLEETASLVYGDIWFAGRYARGQVSERFQFTTLVQEVAIERGGVPVFRDRFCWQGPWDTGTAFWHFGDAPACGSLSVFGPLPKPLVPASSVPEPAIFQTAAGDTCLRWVGSSEPVTGAVVRTALESGALLANPPATGPWLLPACGLGPNHWFSLPPNGP
jgi:urease accessory protein